MRYFLEENHSSTHWRYLQKHAYSAIWTSLIFSLILGNLLAYYLIDLNFFSINQYELVFGLSGLMVFLLLFQITTKGTVMFLRVLFAKLKKKRIISTKTKEGYLTEIERT